jgi:hypothetical protein
MKEQHFIIQAFRPGDKEITVTGGALYMQIDFDDVDYDAVENHVKKMVDILNKHWGD